VLKRGFALVRDAHGEAVTMADQARAAEHLSITFQGQQSVAVTVDGSAPAPRPAPPKPSPKGKDVRQGSLL